MTDEPTRHPTQLLPEYVDGDLAPEDRARVETHVAGCPVCSDEVVQARLARASLTSLPELEAPPGIALAVRRRAGPGPRSGRVWRAAGIAAVAAAVLAGGVVVLTTLPQDEARQAAGGGGGERPAAGEVPEAAPEAEPDDGTDVQAAAAPGVVPVYEESNTDYAVADLRVLAQRLADRSGAALNEGLARTAEGYYEEFDPAAFTTEIRQAIRCVIEDVPPDQLVVPFTIEAATFEGEPAFVASFLEGPAPDQPYDRLLIWVVDRQTCSLRTFVSQRL
jgi:anti-sigma factor RsiW